MCTEGTATKVSVPTAQFQPLNSPSPNNPQHSGRCMSSKVSVVACMYVCTPALLPWVAYQLEINSLPTEN